MELKTCPNGHTYDPSISASCPICGGGNTVPSFGAPSPSFGVSGDVGHTIPLDFSTGGTAPTVPLQNSWAPVPPTQPVSVAASSDPWADPSAGIGQNNDHHNVTEPVRINVPGATTKTQPLTGWLVCVDGPEKGKDYRIHEEYNYIGRSPAMDVCIANDGSISWERHAIIAYDRRSRKFFFAPFGGGSIVRVNDMPVMGNMELNAGDKIEIGRSTFVFVPFCGESFQWED